MSKQARRYSITINNPFWEPNFEEIDIAKTNLPLKLDYLNLKYIDFFKELFDFHYVKSKVKETKTELVKKVNSLGVEETTEEEIATEFDAVIKRPYFKNYDAVCSFFEKLEDCKYCVGQLEEGNENHTKHIQSFVVFKNPKWFERVKVLFPTAHIEVAKGTNVQNRDYCSKSETKLYDAFEFGVFAEERARTDLKTFFELLDAGATDLELRELSPTLYLKEFSKINELRLTRKKEIYSKQKRDVVVTYVYGPPGSGKSTYVDDLTINDDVFRVDCFDKSAFTGYSGEDTLIIDEFKGQFNIQFMNRLLDCFPLKLRGLCSLLPACYTKVYVISNFPYTDLYKSEQEENEAQYRGFTRRLNNIIQFVKLGCPKVRRETIFEEIPKSQVKPFGRHNRVKQINEFDCYGKKTIVYDLEKGFQLDFCEIDEQKQIEEIFPS